MEVTPFTPLLFGFTMSEKGSGFSTFNQSSLELLSYNSPFLPHLPPCCVFKKPGRLLPQGPVACCLLCQKQCSRFLSNSPLCFLQVFAQMLPFSEALLDTPFKSLLFPLKPFPYFLLYFSSYHSSPLTCYLFN